MTLALDRCTVSYKNANVRAWLRVVREGESDQTDDAYRVLFGGKLVDVPPWVHPFYGRTTTEVGHTTAFGAYQFLGTSFKEAAVAIGTGNNASPVYQDLCAVWTIEVKRRALAPVMAGDVVLAASKLALEWTSLPHLGIERIQRVFQAYGGRRGTVQQPGVTMPKKPPLTIDSTYYEGRTFSPEVDHTIPATPLHPNPIQLNVGADGIGLILFHVDSRHAKVYDFSIAPYPTPANQSQQRIVSINKNKGDFTSGAREGYDVNIKGMIGPLSGQNAKLYVSLEDGADYYYNVANAYPDAAGGDMRIQPSFSPT